jgi:hypothetical protein
MTINPTVQVQTTKFIDSLLKYQDQDVVISLSTPVLGAVFMSYFRACVEQGDPQGIEAIALFVKTVQEDSPEVGQILADFVFEVFSPKE